MLAGRQCCLESFPKRSAVSCVAAPPRVPGGIVTRSSISRTSGGPVASGLALGRTKREQCFCPAILVMEAWAAAAARCECAEIRRVHSSARCNANCFLFCGLVELEVGLLRRWAISDQHLRSLPVLAHQEPDLGSQAKSVPGLRDLLPVDQNLAVLDLPRCGQRGSCVITLSRHQEALELLSSLFVRFVSLNLSRRYISDKA